MARPTRLKVLGDRSVPSDVVGQADDRQVIQAFPPAAPVAEAGSPLAEDILEILRKSHERIASEAHQAVSVASAAIEQATAANSGIATLADRASAVEAQMAHVGEVTLAALNEHSTAKSAARQAVAEASLGIIQRLTSYVVDRAPAFLALGASVWLWGKVLGDPQPLQLVALGLFGAVVVAPAVWLSARRV